MELLKYILLTCLAIGGLAIFPYGCAQDSKRYVERYNRDLEQKKQELISYAKIFCKCQGGVSNINFFHNNKTANIYCMNGSESKATPVESVIFERECK